MERRRRRVRYKGGEMNEGRKMEETRRVIKREQGEGRARKRIKERRRKRGEKEKKIGMKRAMRGK